MIKFLNLFKLKNAASTNKKRAFTLAEAVIAIAIVGVVAAVTISVFIPKIHTKVRDRQISAAKIKFTKAMEVMSLNEDLGPYYSNTADFVNHLQKYFKVAKVCDNEHLNECFGYDKITLTNGEEFEINEIKKGANMGMDKKDYGETIGLITLDGTSMLISWKKNCDMIPPNVYEWANDTNETTKCTAIIMDVNGDKTPNKENKDIVLFNAAKIAESCGMSFTVGGKKYCWDEPFAPTYLTKAQCQEVSGINSCAANVADYWAGAYKQCQDDGKRLPNAGELAALAAYLYDKDTVGGDTAQVLGTLNTMKLSNLSNILSTTYASYGYFYLWSSLEYSANDAYRRAFSSGSSKYNNAFRFTSNILGVCVP